MAEDVRDVPDEVLIADNRNSAVFHEIQLNRNDIVGQNVLENLVDVLESLTDLVCNCELRRC